MPCGRALIVAFAWTLSLSTILSPRAAIAQYSCATATSVPVGSVYAGSNAASPGDGVVGLCAPTSKAVWHFFTAPVSGLYTISLCNSSINTVATLYDACAGSLLACDDDTCGDDAVIVYSLTAGSSYRLRVASYGTTAGGSYTLFIQPPGAPPQNQSCVQPITLQPGVPFPTSNISAFGTDETPSCGLFDTSEVWFAFQPPYTGLYRVQVCAASFAPVLSAHLSCLNNAPIACASDTTIPGCSARGASIDFSLADTNGTVLIRVAGARGSFGTFTITMYAPQPNDLCASAIALSAGTPYSGLTSPVLTTDTTVACAASGLDVWHRFTPVSSGPYAFSACASQFDTVLSLHSDCPQVAGSTVIACNDDFCGTQSRLVAMLQGFTTYYLRVAGKGASPAFGPYTVQVDPQSPANDTCNAATTLVEGVPISGDTFGSTGTAAACGSGDLTDVWYAFTPAASTTYEFNTCGSSLDTTIGLYTSCSGAALACGAPSPAFCGPGSHGALLRAALTANFKYFIRIAGTNQNQGAFTLTVARTPPQNDACASALPLTLGTPVAGTLTGALGSGFSSCSVQDGADAWYTFVPSQTRFYTISLCGSVLDGVLALHTTCSSASLLACNSGSTECSDGRASITQMLQSGATYRVRVLAKPGSSSGGAFTLRIINAPPPNDDCAHPATLTLGQSITSTTLDATPTGGFTPCISGANRDVWFTFTPPATGTYQVSTCGATTTLDTVLSIHTACGVAAIACNDNDVATCGTTGPSRIVQYLQSGQPYLIRVAGANDTSGAFTLSVSFSAPANDTCAAATKVGEGQFAFDNLAATTDAVFLDASCTMGFNLISRDVWFRFTSPRTGTEVASVCGATFDTAMAVSSATNGCPTGTYSVIACNDDAPCVDGSSAPTPQSKVTFSAQQGQSYYIRVGSRFGDTGSGILRILPPGGCVCDWNKDGVLTVQDIFSFLASWFAHAGDFNANGATNIQDVLDFLGCFFTRPPGCG